MFFPVFRTAAGSGKASFGPHKARELLQLTDDCFSSPVDPLHALHVFGVAGRQVRQECTTLTNEEFSNFQIKSKFVCRLGLMIDTSNGLRPMAVHVALEELGHSSILHSSFFLRMMIIPTRLPALGRGS